MINNNGLAAMQAEERRRYEESPWDRQGCCKLCRRPKKEYEDIIEVKTAFGIIRLDWEHRRVKLNGERIYLRPTSELAILRWLLREPEAVLSDENMIKVCSSWAGEGKKLAKVYACRLRNALGRESFGKCICTVWGVGYRFVPFPDGSGWQWTRKAR